VPQLEECRRNGGGPLAPTKARVALDRVLRVVRVEGRRWGEALPST
jgi:hypothetical protein